MRSYDELSRHFRLYFIVRSSQKTTDDRVLPAAAAQQARFFEDAPVPYVVGTPEGHIKRVNRAALDRLGYERAELEGVPVHTLYADTSEGRARAAKALHRLQRGEELVAEEAQMVTKNGAPFWARITVRSVRNEAGEVVAHWGVFIDIEEQKALERALRNEREASDAEVYRRTAALQEANASLRAEVRERKRVQAAQQKQLTAMEAAVVGMSLHEPDGTFLYANQAHADVYGYDTPDELIGTSWRILYAEPEQERIEAEALSKLSKGERWTGEVKGRCRDGSEVDVFLSLTPLEDGGLACVCQDITERKEQAQALQRYANRLETLHAIDRAILAAESPQAIADAALSRVYAQLPCQRASSVIFDFEAGEGEVLAHVHEGASQIGVGQRFPLRAFRITDDLREGMPEVVNDLEAVTPTPLLERLLAEGIRSYISLPMMLEDELIGIINLGAREKNVFTAGYQDLMREITDQVTIAIRQARLLRRVQQQAEVLEARVAERTEELESFTYSVSHDLRTPLRAIDGFARLLDQEYRNVLDDEGQRLLSVIRSSASRMGQLIDDLLALSRLGRQEMRHAPIDMEELTHTVLDELLRSQPDGHVDITLQPLPQATGDRGMVRTLLTNLLSNSLKFTREEEMPAIEVGAKAEGDATVYYVADNGAGFDMAYADKLFGVFQRLHDDETFEGTGVGLAIAERVVRRHGGSIWGEGDVGEGATFYFTFDDVLENALDDPTDGQAPNPA